MKKYQLDTKTADILNRFPALRKRLESAERTPAAPGVPRVLCLGADLEKAGACVAVQCGLGEPLNLGTLTRETLAGLVPVLRARGWRCVVGLEACGFGWGAPRDQAPAWSRGEKRPTTSSTTTSATSRPHPTKPHSRRSQAPAKASTPVSSPAT